MLKSPLLKVLYEQPGSMHVNFIGPLPLPFPADLPFPTTDWTAADASLFTAD